jgi:hypothetical protein
VKENANQWKMDPWVISYTVNPCLFLTIKYKQKKRESFKKIKEIIILKELKDEKNRTKEERMKDIIMKWEFWQQKKSNTVVVLFSSKIIIYSLCNSWEFRWNCWWWWFAKSTRSEELLKRSIPAFSDEFDDAPGLPADGWTSGDNWDPHADFIILLLLLFDGPLFPLI